MKNLKEIVNKVYKSGKRYRGKLPRGVKEVFSSSQKVNLIWEKEWFSASYPIIKLEEPLQRDILVSVAKDQGYLTEISESHLGVAIMIYKVEQLPDGDTRKRLHTCFGEGEKEIFCMGGIGDYYRLEILESYLQKKYGG